MANNNSVNNLFLNQKIIQTATNYTALANDVIIEVTNTAAPRTITLPAPSSNNIGKFYIIKDTSGVASINNISITPTTGSIDGASSKVINSNYGAVQVYSDGTNYFAQAIVAPRPVGISLARASWSKISTTPFTPGVTSPGSSNINVLSSSASRIDVAGLTAIISPINLSVAASSPAQSITITQAGLYYICYNTTEFNSGNGGDGYTQIVKNNQIVTVSQNSLWGSTAYPFSTAQAAITTTCAVNDVLDVRVGQQGGSTPSYYYIGYCIQQLPTTYF